MDKHSLCYCIPNLQNQYIERHCVGRTLASVGRTLASVEIFVHTFKVMHALIRYKIVSNEWRPYTILSYSYGSITEQSFFIIAAVILI